jgi:hypothetical protein
MPAYRLRAGILSYLQQEGEVYLPPEQLEKLYLDLKEHADQIIKDIEAGRMDGVKAATPRSLFRNLARHEQRILKRLLPEPEDPLRQAYDHFTELDAQVFPLEVAGQLHEKDIIETIRISPRDAQRGFSHNGYSDKVSGDAVYHFGGFFKRSWRSNDILWGRLDGVCQLTEALLTPDRLRQIVENDSWRKRLCDHFFESEPPDKPAFKVALDPAKLFPNAGVETHSRYKRWLRSLLSDEPAERQQALGEQFTLMIDLIIEAAQLEIINEELPNVIYAAFIEQMEWNRFQVTAKTQKQQNVPPKQGLSRSKSVDQDEVTSKPEPPPWVFQPGRGHLDPLMVTFRGIELAKTALDQFNMAGRVSMRPSDTRLGRFFKASYRVGSEKLTRDIPTVVLLEILATTLLVLRNCILSLLGEKAKRVQRHPLYFFGLNLPLQAFYALVVLSRRSPGWVFATFVAVGIICILALMVGIIWWGQLIYAPGGVFYLRELLIFIIAPVIVLLALLIGLTWKGRISRPSE